MGGETGGRGRGEVGPYPIEARVALLRFRAGQVSETVVLGLCVIVRAVVEGYASTMADVSKPGTLL